MLSVTLTTDQSSNGCYNCIGQAGPYQPAVKMVTNICSMQISNPCVVFSVDTLHSISIFFFVNFIHLSSWLFSAYWFKKVCTLIKHSVTKFSVIPLSLHFLKKYFPKVRIFMRIMILWYYQIRPKVVWKVHGAWIDGYFLSIILASLRLEHYARYDSENKDKPLP